MVGLLTVTLLLVVSGWRAESCLTPHERNPSGRIAPVKVQATGPVAATAALTQDSSWISSDLLIERVTWRLGDPRGTDLKIGPPFPLFGGLPCPPIDCVPYAP
jgi:hypothetical protein